MAFVMLDIVNVGPSPLLHSQKVDHPQMGAKKLELLRHVEESDFRILEHAFGVEDDPVIQLIEGAEIVADVIDLIEGDACLLEAIPDGAGWQVVC